MNKIFSIFFLFLFVGLGVNIQNPKGLAMAYPVYQEDLQRLGDNVWFYDWASNHYNNPNYVPMSYKGEDPNLSFEYSGYILLFNEPNGEVPYGYPINVSDGVSIYAGLIQEYPHAKFVVGNVIFWGSWNDWIVDFKNLCQQQGISVPNYWGLHVYLDTKGYEDYFTSFTINELTALHDQIGGTFWITEFADIHANILMDDRLIQIFESHNWIDRWAYFTNRISGEAGEPIPPGWTCELFNWSTGNPTLVGSWYIGEEYHQKFLSLIMRHP